MVWTEPKTWVAEPLVAADLNTYLRDNLNALKEPPSAHYELDESADYTTTSTSFVNVDSTDGKLSLKINTNGGDVLVGFHGYVQPGTGNDIVFFDIEVDGVRVGGDDGIIGAQRAAAATNPGRFGISFTRLIPNLDPGEHTFNLQWRVTVGQAVIFAGAGTANANTHPQFWVREVS